MREIMNPKQGKAKSSTWRWSFLFTTAVSVAGVILLNRRRRLMRRNDNRESNMATDPLNSLTESEETIRYHQPFEEKKSPPLPVEAPEPAPEKRPEPANWQEQEPEDPTDPAPHLLHEQRSGIHGWHIVAASRRGRMHAHQGTYREDAFAVGIVGQWHIIAVADGAGSAALSRVGSHLAVTTAASSLQESLTTMNKPTDEQLGQFLDQALQIAYEAVHREAEQRDIATKDLSSTLLLMLHRPLEAVHIVASTQVGDGLMAIQYADGSIEPLAERDSGAFGGETYFLTSKPIAAWQRRSLVRHCVQPPTLLVAMTDGVADDFIPYEQYLSVLMQNLRKNVASKVEAGSGNPDEILLQLLDYDRRGSFDDRTLVMLYQDGEQ